MAMKGGAKLEAYFKQAAARVSQPGTLEVGFPSGDTYANGVSIPMVAALNEYGVPSRNQPPRPFFRNMIAADSPQWGKTMGTLLKAMDGDGHKVLTQMGELIAGQLEKSITEFTSPPLSPKTIARKGWSQPLVDSGVLKMSIKYKVTDE